MTEAFTVCVQGRKRKGPGRPKKHPMIVESDNDESEIVSLYIIELNTIVLHVLVCSV